MAIVLCIDQIPQALPATLRTKRNEGKRHNAAVVALTRRRLNVLFAMMRSGELYRDIPTAQEAAAA